VDEKKFQTALERFLTLCAVDPDCASFGDYFKKYYAMRAEEWANCHRKGACLNTNCDEAVYYVRHWYVVLLTAAIPFIRVGDLWSTRLP